MCSISGGDHIFCVGTDGGLEREGSTRSGGGVLSGESWACPENLIAMIGEELSLFGVEKTDIQGQFNAPLQKGLLDVGLGTQKVAGVSEGNPAAVEQLVDVRGE